jgi:predicted phosphoribosyltransferase
VALLIEDETLRNKVSVFEDREDAGGKLASSLIRFSSANTIVLAIPSGGVPVGKVVQRHLGCDFDLLIVRKVQIPWNTEAGFGAVNLDGDVLFNEGLLGVLGLPDEDISRQVAITQEILEKRNSLFRQDNPFPSLQDRSVILVDDGLASGFTMLAALEFVKKRDPGEVIVAVPTGSFETVQKVMKRVDRVYCLNVREKFPFAVASAYRNWYDLSDTEVINLVKSI